MTTLPRRTTKLSTNGSRRTVSTRTTSRSLSRRISIADEMLKTVRASLRPLRDAFLRALAGIPPLDHDASGDAIVRTTGYSLPEHLHNHIELVQPTHHHVLAYEGPEDEPPL